MRKSNLDTSVLWRKSEKKAEKTWNHRSNVDSGDLIYLSAICHLYTDVSTTILSFSFLLSLL